MGAAVVGPRVVHVRQSHLSPLPRRKDHPAAVGVPDGGLPLPGAPHLHAFTTDQGLRITPHAYLAPASPVLRVSASGPKTS